MQARELADSDLILWHVDTALMLVRRAHLLAFQGPRGPPQRYWLCVGFLSTRSQGPNAWGRIWAMV